MAYFRVQCIKKRITKSAFILEAESQEAANKEITDNRLFDTMTFETIEDDGEVEQSRDFELGPCSRHDYRDLPVISRDMPRIERAADILEFSFDPSDMHEDDILFLRSCPDGLIMTILEESDTEFKKYWIEDLFKAIGRPCPEL